jgi:hypothetical protein
MASNKSHRSDFIHIQFEVPLQFLKRSGQLALTLLLLNGCAGPAGGERSAEPSIVSTTSGARAMKVVATNKGNETVSSRADERNLSASFRAIPGALVGPVVADSILFIPVRFGETIALPLADLQKSIAPLASPEIAGMLAIGVVVQPSDARFVRVGTFFYDRDKERDVLGAGMFDADTGENIMLAYFDRPCTIRGVVQAEGKAISISVDIPEAGMHWIRLADVDATHQKLFNDASNTPLRYAVTE